MKMLGSLQKVMSQKGMPYNNVPMRLPSLDLKFQFNCFFNSQFRTAERITSLLDLGVSVEDVELELNDATYQEKVLYCAMCNLYEANLWFKSYEDQKSKVQ